jgi:hypothetical protein
MEVPPLPLGFKALVTDSAQMVERRKWVPFQANFELQERKKFVCHVYVNYTLVHIS